jgi:hypothetical protein
MNFTPNSDEAPEKVAHREGVGYRPLLRSGAEDVSGQGRYSARSWCVWLPNPKFFGGARPVVLVGWAEDVVETSAGPQPSQGK